VVAGLLREAADEAAASVEIPTDCETTRDFSLLLSNLR
jgi:hypothetical protein